jgi:hypothetical protein
MGDRTYTQIEFTGEISEEIATELVELLEAQDCVSNHDDYGSHGSLLAGLKTAHNSFYDSECNYAMMEDIEAWCRDNDVGYLKSWMAGDEYGPGIKLWRPGMEAAEECAALDDSPIATLSELQKAHEAGTVGDLIKHLDRFTSLGPPLKVLAVDDWTPELCARMAKRALEAEDA